MIKKPNQKKIIKTQTKEIIEGTRICFQRDGWRGNEIVGSASNFYQGWLDVKDIPAGGLGILVEMHHSAGWRPRLFRLEGYKRKLQEICLGWVEDEILPDGWIGKRSGEGESRRGVRN